VGTLAAGRALWGNAPDVLRRVRDPRQLAAGLNKHGFSVPELRLAPTAKSPWADQGTDEWLVKPLRSGGGQHVRRWQGEPLSRLCWLQEWIDGRPGSVVFAAAGGRAVPLGVSRQLVGDAAFGSSGFRYCGSIIAAPHDSEFSGGIAVVDRASALAGAAAFEFGLRGVNGIDFVASGNELFPIEMNPRWSSSMELVERLFGWSVFGVHAAACAQATLLPFDLPAATHGVSAVGKAIVFARTELLLGDTRGWLADPTVRDVPHPGERIHAGQPICTVFAGGAAGRRCYEALVTRAERLYLDLAACSAAASAP
jgi:predicted ATP-grasp superfamily ATP-dependent carboligase